MFPKPTSCSGLGDFSNRDIDTVIFLGGSIAENESHLFRHFTSHELWGCSSCHEQSLVDIVMEDTPEAILVFPTQFHTGGFHYRVADGIGMADAFSIQQYVKMILFI